MAGDWIKTRVWLCRDPKVFRMADYLAEQRSFMNWLTDPVQRTCKESAYEHVTRNVTVALCVTGLVVTWGTARDRGDREGDDLVLDGCTIDDLSSLTDIPNFGHAMQSVGWVKPVGKCAVLFPKFFKENDSPNDRHKRQAAERQARFRNAQRNVTGNAQGNASSNVTVTHREEKRREEIKSKALPPHSNGDSYSSAVPSTTDVYKKLKPEKAKTANGPQTFAQVTANLPQAQTAGGLNEPAPNVESSDQRSARLERNKARQLAAIEQRAKADSASLPKADHEGPNGATASSPPINTNVMTAVPPKPPPDAWRTNDAAAYAKALELKIPLQGMTWQAIRTAIGAREGKA